MRDRRQISPSFEIAPQELKRKLQKGDRIALIDVRQPEEWAVCRLEKAKLIPLAELPRRAAELNPGEPIVLYCHHGMRSARAAEFLRKLGFKNVRNLKGRIEGWALCVDPKMKRY